MTTAPVHRTCFVRPNPKGAVTDWLPDMEEAIGLGIIAWEGYQNDAFVLLLCESNTELGPFGEWCIAPQIFKKTAPLGHSKTLSIKGDAGSYQRTVMGLILKNDPQLLRAYVDIHKPENIWPEVLDNMHQIGVLDMELYLMGNHAFMVMDTDLDFNREEEGIKWAEMPREKEWQAFVSKYQETDSHSKSMEKWKMMPRLDLKQL